MSVRPNRRKERFRRKLGSEAVEERQLRMQRLLSEALEIAVELRLGTGYVEVEVEDKLDGGGLLVLTVDAATDEVLRWRDATPEDRTIAIPGT